MSNKNIKNPQSENDEKLEKLQEWIKTQPDLPQNIEKVLLLRFLKTYKFNLDKVKDRIKYSFNLRAKNPQIFTRRDFTSSEIQDVFRVCEMIPMLKATPENYKCCIFRLADFKSNSWNFTDVIKAFFMVADVRLVSPDPNPSKLADGEVPIFDMKGLSLWHIFKVSISTLRLYFKYVQEAHPVKVREIHIYNCTPLINRIMSLIKPLLKAEVASKFQFHVPDSDTIFDYIPKEVLPDEYNGTAGPIADIKEYWEKTFLKKRDYIMNDANWIVDNTADDANNNEAFYN